MPLCTILTKCPAPFGPAVQYSCSAASGLFTTRVRDAPMPGASDTKSGSRCWTTVGSPRSSCRPRSRPQTPPARPHVHVVDAPAASSFARRMSSTLRIATVDQDVAFLEQRTRSWMLASTTAAGTINQMARGLLSFGTNSASDAPPARLPTLAPSPRQGCGRRHACVLVAQEAAHHVRAHTAKTDHSGAA